MESSKVKELEAKVAELTKENGRLKNELKFTKDTERRAAGEQINVLRKTLDMLQAKNDQLSSELIQAEGRLKNSQISQAKEETSSSAKLAAQSAALVQRLSSAQRERERTLASELRKIMNEKKQLEKQLGREDAGSSSLPEQEEEMEPTQSSQEMLQVAEKLADTSGVASLQQMGDELISLVQQSHKVKERSVKSSLEELKHKLLEAEKKKIEAEERIGKLKRQLEMTKTEYKLVDKARIKSLQTQLQAALSDRDNWQERAETYEDKLETLQILNTLQKSMSKEDDIREKYEVHMKKLEEDVSQLNQHCSQLLQDRTQLLQSREALVLQLRQCQEEHKVNMEKYKSESDRLKRLVVILRRKLNSSAHSSTSSSQYEV